MQVAFCGTLTVASADNLAAWNIGGYKALASAFRKCQYCMVVDEGMQTKVQYFVLLLYPFMPYLMIIIHCLHPKVWNYCQLKTPRYTGSLLPAFHGYTEIMLRCTLWLYSIVNLWLSLAKCIYNPGVSICVVHWKCCPTVHEAGIQLQSGRASTWPHCHNLWSCVQFSFECLPLFPCNKWYGSWHHAQYPGGVIGTLHVPSTDSSDSWRETVFCCYPQCSHSLHELRALRGEEQTNRDCTSFSIVRRSPKTIWYVIQ